MTIDNEVSLWRPVPREWTCKNNGDARHQCLNLRQKIRRPLQLRGMHQHRIDRRKSTQKIKAILSRVGRQYIVLHRLHHQLARREPFRLLFLDHEYHQRSHYALPYRVPPMRAPLRVSGWFRFADKNVTAARGTASELLRL